MTVGGATAPVPSGNSNLIQGGAGNSTINGTAGNDVIIDAGGYNTIDGKGGNDSITTGPGNDTIDGGDGNDVINAGDGNNTVNGGKGNDQITAGSGNDNVDGGAGTDSCKCRWRKEHDQGLRALRRSQSHTLRGPASAGPPISARHSPPPIGLTTLATAARLIRLLAVDRLLTRERA